MTRPIRRIIIRRRAAKMDTARAVSRQSRERLLEAFERAQALSAHMKPRSQQR